MDNMFQTSIETFLRVNTEEKFTLFLIWKEARGDTPAYACRLVQRYGARFSCEHIQLPAKLYDSKLSLYSYRFSKVLTDILPDDHVVYMDLDLYHSKEISSVINEHADWGKVNLCLDLWGYSCNDSVLSFHNRHHRAYLNTGLVAWDSCAPMPKKIFGKLMDLSRTGDLSDSDFPYHDQDLFNEILSKGDSQAYRESINLLPEVLNHSPRCLGNVIDMVTVSQIAKTMGTRVFHIMSFQAQRLEFFERMPQSEGWLEESLQSTAPRKGSDLRIVVISHNQAPSIPLMKEYLDKHFPGCPVTLVLDRCTDHSEDVAAKVNIPFITNWEGEGFLAGRMRDKGLECSGVSDTLFLDGDRIPSGGFSYMDARTALDMYDVTIMPIAEGEFRAWFRQDQYVANPNYGKWDNDVFTCGMVVRKEALEKIKEAQNNLLFVKDFDGQFGEEDRYLGDIAYHLGLTCGGFPLRMALSGAFRPSGDRGGFDRNIKVRSRLRSSLSVLRETSSSLYEVKRVDIRGKIRGRA